MGLTSRIRQWFSARGVILLYHRVAAPSLDPWSLAVTPDMFAEHMEVLRRCFAPLSLPDFLNAVERRRGGDLPVAVTFDDGYADNYLAALPVLERFDVPATCFVATGLVGMRGFWWDDLAHLVLGAKSLSGRLELEVDGSQRAWELGRYGADEPLHEENGSRETLHQELWSALSNGSEGFRRDALERIRTLAVGLGDEPLECRPLDLQELSSLASHELVDIGAHTATHPRLASLTLEEQRKEVITSRNFLQERLGVAPLAFAYPFGRPGTYDPATAALVREAGFRLACANRSGTVDRWSNRYELPRLYIHEESGEDLERRLRSAVAGREVRV